MDQNRGKIFILFACFLCGRLSLFATEVRLGDYYCVDPHVLTFGFESVIFRADSVEAKKKAQKDSPFFLYLQSNTIFTAPNYLLERVIYMKYPDKATATEIIYKIPLKTENKQINHQEADNTLKTVNPIEGLPIKDAEHFIEVTVSFTTPNVNKTPLNSVIVSKACTDFFSSANQVGTVVFCKNQQWHFFFESQDHIARPPPFFLTQG